MNSFDQNMFDEIERDERWLAGLSTPGPSLESVEAVKRRVRDELSAARRRRMGWPAWIGALSAAALIVLAVTIGWQSRSVSTPLAEDAVANSTQATVDSDSATVAMVNLENTLSELETSSKDSMWDLEGRALSDVYDEAFSDSSGSPRDQKNGKSG